MVIYMYTQSRCYMVRHNENEVLTQLKKQRRNYITIIKMEKLKKKSFKMTEVIKTIQQVLTDHNEGRHKAYR